MKHMRSITRIPAAAQEEDLTLPEILEIIASVIEALAPILGKSDTAA